MAGRGGQGFGGRCDPPGPPVLLLLAPALHGWLGHLESAWALLWLGSHDWASAHLHYLGLCMAAGPPYMPSGSSRGSEV